MRVLITGARGQLGRALVDLGRGQGWQLWAYDLPEFDLTDVGAVQEAVRTAQPEVIFNAAAFTAVDRAEEEPEAAFAVNARAVATLASVADEVGALLVHLSTDYVFDGQNSRPYREDDPPNPLSVYGRSKLEGEKAAARASKHLIVRTSWLFGRGWNFVEAIRKQLLGGARELRVVADQFGRPTYAEDLAEALVRLVNAGAYGLFHVANTGETNWAGFAREIAAQLGFSVPVVDISTEEAGRPAPRPRYSVLDTAKFDSLGQPLPPWQEALARYLRATSR
ncbi:MAG: NAD(P)-dependent oxidoreductase [Thermoanaerobaculum sp.]|nr:MAG: NAD(P)-dependent oxidoreductase [Thermoanaerobaculum sp.]